MTLRNIPGVRRRGAAMLFAAALSLYGCIDRRDLYDPDLEMTFDPCRNLETFGVRAWACPEGSGPAEGTLLLDDVRIIRDGGKWLPEKPLLWPARDRKVFVLAYAPYGTASAISPERGVEFEGIDAEAIAEDLLYSDPVPDASKGRDGVIPLTFYPALCRVDFRLRTDAFPVEKVEVKALRALTLVTRGDFQSLPSPKWTLSGNPGPVTLAEGSFLLEGEPTVISGNHPLIPQRISTRFEAEIDYTDTNGIPSHWTVSTEPVEKNFIPGRSYYVDLMFSVETCTLTTL